MVIWIITHVPSSNGKTPEEANTVVSAENNDEKIAAIVGEVLLSHLQNSPSEATQVYKAFNNMERLLSTLMKVLKRYKAFYNDGVEMAGRFNVSLLFYSAITSARNAIVTKAFGFDDSENQAQPGKSNWKQNVDLVRLKQR